MPTFGDPKYTWPGDLWPAKGPAAEVWAAKVLVDTQPKSALPPKTDRCGGEDMTGLPPKSEWRMDGGSRHPPSTGNVLTVVELSTGADLVEELWGLKAREQWLAGIREGA